MQRRTFTHHLTAGFALPLLRPVWREQRRTILPPRLRAGDTVGLITPGSYLDEEGLEKAVRQIESLGLRTRLGANIRAEHGFVAGTDAERLAGLHTMFADESVRAIWCARGGYGCGRLLPELDYRLIRRNPKVLIGYSDITALLMAITKETGLVTFHGPVGASTFTDYTARYLRAALLADHTFETITLPPVVAEEKDMAYASYVIRGGTAEGTLWGGNLSLLAALAGTDYAPSIRGSLLFIEEIGEKPYRIDRMLTQLHQAWDLRTAAGIVLGVFRDCEADADDRSLTLRETLTEQLAGLGIPVAYGFPIGHISDMCTLPVGMSARADMTAMTLRVNG